MNRKEYRKLYYQKNKKKIDAKNKKWQDEHPEKRKSYFKKYHRSPKGIFSTLKENSKKNDRGFKLGKEEFLIWYESEEKKCFYCDVEESVLPEEFKKVGVSRNGYVRRLTIDRLDNNEPYSIDNIVLACSQCNRIKGDFLTQYEMIKIGQRVIKPKWQNLSK